MGCDIHLYVEKLKSDKWVAVDKWEVNPKWPDEGPLVDYKESFYSERNYQLFAVLANVRNGFGFAGVPTGNAMVPIHEPRGLPDDCCDEIRKYSDKWGVDGHSHSWATVQELLEYDWTRTTIRQGFVDLKQWARFKQWGSPESWSGGISGPNVVHVDVDQIELIWNEFYSDHHLYQCYYNNDGVTDQLNKRLTGDPEKTAYTSIRWTRTYYQCCSNFLSNTLPRLLQVGPYDKVRIVYWFDN